MVSQEEGDSSDNRSSPMANPEAEETSPEEEEINAQEALEEIPQPPLGPTDSCPRSGEVNRAYEVFDKSPHLNIISITPLVLFSYLFI